MKTAQEMVQILERKIKIYWELFRKYEKKHIEENNENWFTIAKQIWSKIELLQELYEEFTSKKYIFKEEN